MSAFSAIYQKLLDSTPIGRLAELYVARTGGTFVDDVTFPALNTGVAFANGGKIYDTAAATTIRMQPNKPLRVLLADGSTVVLEASGTVFRWGGNDVWHSGNLTKTEIADIALIQSIIFG